MRWCHEGECRADQFHTRPHLRPVKTLQMRVTCGTLHGTPTLPASGAPSITPTGGCPLRPLGPQHQVHLLPLASGMWCPCYLCLGPLCPPEDKPGSVAGGGEPPPVVPPRPPAGGRAQPRAAQPAGWPAGDHRGRAESSRTATHLAHPRRPRNEGCSLFNATPCGALGDAASLWSQLADAAWTGLRPQWRDQGVSQGQASLTLALPRKFPSQTSHSLGCLCHFYFFFLFL